MKNATEYGKKIKRMLPSLKKRFSATHPPDDLAPLEVFVLAVLREQSTLPAALTALQTLREEFVDFNELRVAPAKDIVELLSDEIPDRREKALRMTDGLHRIYDQRNRLDFEHTAEMGKRDLQAHLREALGFGSFVEAYLLGRLFGHRAMPVDARLVQRLQADGLVGSDADVDDVRTLLERVVPANEQAEVFELLAQYAQEPIKASARSASGRGKMAKTSSKKTTTAKRAGGKKAKATSTSKTKTAKKTVKKSAKKTAKKTQATKAKAKSAARATGT